MAEVDTSIYKTTPPPAFNPLATYGQVVGIQNAQGQNRLLQQQQDLRAGMGEAIRGAVDPETGKVDTNRLLATVGQDPRTAWNFGDVNAQTQSNVSATASAQQEQLKNTLAHVQAANGFIGSLIGNPKLGQVNMHDDIVKAINDMAAHGASMMDPQAQQNLIASIPQDPAGQLQLVRDKANQNLSLQGQIQQVLGPPSPTNTGAQTNIVRTPAAGGAPQVVGALTNTTGPETQAALVPVYQKQADGTYQQVMVPRSALPGASGAAGGGGAPAAVPTPSARTQSPAAPATGPVSAATPPAAVSGGSVLAAPPPGVTESQQADVTKYKADQAAIPTHATNVQSLQKAKVALEALSGSLLGTGKGTEGLAHIRSVITSLTGAADASTMNYDEAKKYLTDYARQQGAAAHSDLQLQAAQGSNASTEISNKAALDVVKTNIGRERQAIAQVQEHANPTGIGYGSHASSFATKTDPRAFAWDQYTPDERRTIMGNLKGDALKKFKDSIVIADRLGLIRAQ